MEQLSKLSYKLLPDDRELATLPLRGIVALALRCARRVQPIYLEASENHRPPKKHVLAVEDALTIAQAFCKAEPILKPTAGATDAADDAARDAADAARAAARAAAETARAVAYAARDYVDACSYNYLVRAAAYAIADATRADATHTTDSYAEVASALASRCDFFFLRDYYHGAKRDPGQPIDPTESGPLGSYWPLDRMKLLAMGLKFASASRSTDIKEEPPKPEIAIFSGITFPTTCERMDDFKWLEEAEAKGELRQYSGHKIAILNKTVVGVGDSGLELRDAVCQEYNVPAHRPFITYVHGETD